MDSEIIKKQREKMINYFISNEDLQPSVLFQLARMFKCKARLLKEKSKGGSRVETLEARLKDDCLAVLPLLEDLGNDQTAGSSSIQLYQLLRKSLDKVELTDAIEEDDGTEELLTNKSPGFSFQQGQGKRTNVESASSAAQQVVNAIESLKKENCKDRRELVSKLDELIKVTIAKEAKQTPVTTLFTKDGSPSIFKNQEVPFKESTGINFNFHSEPNAKADPSLLYIFGSNKTTTPGRSFASLPSSSGKSEFQPVAARPILTDVTSTSTSTNVFSNLITKPTTNAASTTNASANMTFGNMTSSPIFKNTAGALSGTQNFSTELTKSLGKLKVNPTVTTTSTTPGFVFSAPVPVSQPAKISLEKQTTSAISNPASITTSIAATNIFGGAQKSISSGTAFSQPNTVTTTAGSIFSKQSAVKGSQIGVKPATTTGTTGYTFGGGIPALRIDTKPTNTFGATKPNKISGGTPATSITNTANSISGSHAVESVSGGQANATPIFGFRAPAVTSAATPATTTTSSPSLFSDTANRFTSKPSFGQTAVPTANFFSPSSAATLQTGNIIGPKTATISPIVAFLKDNGKIESNANVMTTDKPLSFSLSIAKTSMEPPVLKTNSNTTFAGAESLISGTKAVPNGGNETSTETSPNKTKTNDRIPSTTTTNVFRAKDDNGWTVLHSACADGNLDFVKFLVEKGADVNAKNESNETVLHYSCALGKMDIVAFLVEKGADVNVKGHKGATVLHYAAQHKNWDIVKFLADKNADIQAKDDEGRTALHHAAECIEKEIVKFLVDKGADARAENSNGETALHLVVNNFNWNNSALDIIKFLVEKGADVNATSKLGDTPLYFYLKTCRNDLDIIKCLVENGANVCAKGFGGKTPLHCAYSCNYFEIVKFLVDNGADVNAEDDTGKTVLHNVSQTSSLDIVKFLIEKGADISIKDKYGKTALHFARQEGNLNVVRYLIEKGCK